MSLTALILEGYSLLEGSCGEKEKMVFGKCRPLKMSTQAGHAAMRAKKAEPRAAGVSKRQHHQAAQAHGKDVASKFRARFGNR
jgi:hypothetical protein